jgi:undecaprenyl-diphosphatase
MTPGLSLQRLAPLLALALALASACAAADEPPAAPPPMSTLQAAGLGVVEGMTEYLPVSSTGHLLLTQRLMGIGGTPEEKTAADAYAICIQIGAILAVAGLYFRRVRGVAWGFLGRDAEGLRLGCNLLVGFVPAAVAGLLFEGLIKDYLFGGGRWGLWPTAAAWTAGGILILGTDRWFHVRRHDCGASLQALTWRMALGIGLAQCAALWPGVSRSLAAMMGGLLAGLSLPAAVEFSFLLGLLTLSASTAHDALQHGSVMLAQYGWVTILTGVATAAVSAALAVRWLVRYLQHHSLNVFGWYRIALGLATAACLALLA